MVWVLVGIFGFMFLTVDMKGIAVVLILLGLILLVIFALAIIQVGFVLDIAKNLLSFNAGYTYILGAGLLFLLFGRFLSGPRLPVIVLILNSLLWLGAFGIFVYQDFFMQALT